MSWIFAFWSGHVGVTAGCCFKVLLSECCARFWSWLSGAAAGYCCQRAVCNSGMGATAGCCCQSALWAVKLGCWCRCRGCGHLGLTKITFTPCQKRKAFGCRPNISSAIWGLCWRIFSPVWLYIFLSPSCSCSFIFLFSSSSSS